ncbi:MAG: helix-turn-helix domain-containing protein [Pseudobutyrivibrio ruminis]|uniref:AraC family transcriptional regulator n=1 Tax=Pseudobutyrivibrio ruminis TaxID=46206 RepID=UPI0026ED3E4B|nr:AraC family transcriptional regulator [Pseudobutyrivibrio ruminis]MBE5913856.1 helix-turn-helix domain-containing protein [Pseudobutyrivibrio ruminis]
MIETLDGIFETVHYKQSTTLKLYDNREYEDYPKHWHPAIEIVMPVENGYTMQFSNSEVYLREKDICIICPGCVHAIKAPETGRRIIFQPNTTYLRFLREFEVLISFMSPYAIITPEEYPSIHEQLVKMLIEIKEEYMAGTSFSELSIYSKILEMFKLIGRNYSSKSNKTNDTSISSKEDYANKFVEICDYIDSHCSEDLKLDEVADMSGFSKFYFERLFKQFTGTSFYKYVNQKRIAKASELLIEPGNSVTDVALNCGFMSISSFIRMFKLQKGCTPTEFKSMYWSLEIERNGEKAELVQ